MWTEERVANLRKWLAEGLSCSQVAARFGFTKNAVIGKASRLKIRSVAAANYRERAFQNKIKRAKQRAARELARAATALAREAAKRVQKPPKRGEATPDIQALIAIPTADFLSRPHGSCKWPHSDCIEKALELRPYCEAHTRKALA